MENNKKKSSLIRNICIGVFLLVLLVIIYFLFGESFKKYINISFDSLSESTNNLTAVPAAPTAVPAAPASITDSAPVAVSQIAGNRDIKSLLNINNLNTSISEFQKILNK